MEGNMLSPADIAAMGGNGFGGNNSWWIILLFLFMMNGGNGWNRGDYGQYASAASQQEILYNQHFNNLDNKMDRGFTSIGNGIADATFALNNTIHNAQDTVAGAVINEGRGLQMQIGAEARGFQQLANEGICATNRNIDAIRYEAKANTGEIVAAIKADGDATRALIQTNEMQALRDKVQSLEMDNRMCGVVRYPMTYAYSAGNSPFCNCNAQPMCCGCNA